MTWLTGDTKKVKSHSSPSAPIPKKEGDQGVGGQVGLSPPRPDDPECTDSSFEDQGSSVVLDIF